MEFARMAFSQAWQVTALVVFVLLTTRLVARNRPHLAYMLWLVVLIKCVIPPLWSSPSSVFSWLQTALVDRSSQSVTAHALRESPIGIDFEITEYPSGGPGGVEIQVQPYEVSVTQGIAALQVVEDEEPLAPAGLLLVAVWGGSFLLALSVSGSRWLLCVWKLRTTESVPANEIEALVAELAQRLKVRRRVRVLVTTSRVGPAVVGLFRPLIVLPDIVVRDKQPEELEAILAHELLHVRRGDLWLGLLQVCAKAAWWFYPLVWWVSRLSTREAERCCDEEVIGELGCDPKRYARSLIEILELKRTLQPVPAFPGMKPVEVTSQRLERIMKLGQGCHKRTPRWCWAIMLLMAAVALPGAAFIATAEEETEWTDDGHGFTFPAAPHVDVPKDRTVLVGDHKQLVTRSDLVEGKSETAVISAYQAYDTKGVISRIQKELGCSEQEALQTLGNHLICEGHLQESPLVPLKDRVRIWKGDLYVAASEQEHQRIRAALKRIREHGVARLKIEVRFVTTPKDLVESAVVDWHLVPMDLESGDRGVHAAGKAPGQPPLFDAGLAKSKAGIERETRLPAIYKAIDEDEANRLLRTLQQDERTNILATPSVSVFNGQSASIEDAMQRPFVVGLTKDQQPQIRVVKEGTSFHVRPMLREDGALWLNYDLTVSKLQGVQETTLRVAGLKQPLTLQIPEVETTRVESSIGIELGHTLVIGGLQLDDKGKPQSTLVLLTAKRQSDPIDLGINIKNSKSGRFLFGVGVNSDTGIAGQVVSGAEAGATKNAVVPILGPMTAGGQVSALDPPTDDEVLSALKKVSSEGVPFLYAKRLRDVRIVKEKIAEYVDPPRFIPTIGPARLHHAHYKCTVYGDERTKIGWPVPHQTDNQVKRVIYIDHNHYHMVGDVDSNARPGAQDGAARSAEELLDEQISLQFKEAPLAEVLRDIAKQAGVNIVIDDEDIAAAGITTESLVTIVIEEIRAKSALKVVLGSLDLRYEIANEKIVVRGKHSEPVYTKVYNVADLATSDLDDIAPEGFEERTEAPPHVRAIDILIEAITERVEPDSWDDVRGKGAIRPFPSNLSIVVSQTKDGHMEIAKFLGRVRKKIEPTKVGRTKAEHRLLSENARQSTGATKVQAAREQAARLKENESTHVYHKVYNVADLVVPIPNLSASDRPQAVDRQAGDLANTATADFDTLINLIVSTVAPASWEENGGEGVIEEFPTNLSLVISQTSEIHDQIAKLIAQLRKLQEVQILVEARFLQVPDKFFERAGIDFDFATDERKATRLAARDDRSAMLSDHQVGLFLRAAKSSPKAGVIAAPKITLFNGQSGSISLPNGDERLDGTFKFQAVCSGDRRSVRLRFAIGSKANVNDAAVRMVPKGKTLLLNVTEDVTSEMLGVARSGRGVPYLGDIPHIARFFQNAEGSANDRMLVLLTPRIIIQEEEEELLGFDVKKPGDAKP